MLSITKLIKHYDELIKLKDRDVELARKIAEEKEREAAESKRKYESLRGEAIESRKHLQLAKSATNVSEKKRVVSINIYVKHVLGSRRRCDERPAARLPRTVCFDRASPR